MSAAQIFLRDFRDGIKNRQDLLQREKESVRAALRRLLSTVNEKAVLRLLQDELAGLREADAFTEVEIVRCSWAKAKPYLAWRFRTQCTKRPSKATQQGLTRALIALTGLPATDVVVHSFTDMLHVHLYATALYTPHAQ
jgi:hypothetical protein